MVASGRRLCAGPQHSPLLHPALGSMLGNIPTAAWPLCPLSKDTAWEKPGKRHLPCAGVGAGGVRVLYIAMESHDSHACHCILAVLRSLGCGLGCSVSVWSRTRVPEVWRKPGLRRAAGSMSARALSACQAQALHSALGDVG